MTLSELPAGRAAAAGEEPALTEAEPARRGTAVAVALRRVAEPRHRAASAFVVLPASLAGEGRW